MSPAEAAVLSVGEIGTRAFVIRDNVLGSDLCIQGLREAEEVHRKGLLRDASFGKRETVRKSKRSDTIMWLTSERGSHVLKESPGLRRIIEYFRCLRQELIEKHGNVLRLSKKKMSVQLARYSESSRGYVRHTDVLPTDANSGTLCRRITVMYYLNKDWQTCCGGNLRLHFDRRDSSVVSYFDVAPVGDRVLLFRSDVVPHEVRPIRKRPRYALTCWFYGIGPARMPRICRMMTTGSNSIVSVTKIDGRPPPPLPLCDRAGCGRERIFVSIASYRDSQCQPTLLNMFDNAEKPGRVFAGVVWQIDSREDSACFSMSESLRTWRSNIREIFLDSQNATGPCLARATAQLLYRGEEFFLQIDSHMRFRKNWDRYLIEQLRACKIRYGASKPILTTYPIGYTLPNTYPKDCVRGTVLYPSRFDETGMLRQSAKRLNDVPKYPVPSPLWASGFSFSDASIIREVPYDPTLHYLFFGEEIFMAARLFMRGWDFFAPPETVLFHLWSRAHRPTFRERTGEQKQALEKEARTRVLRLLAATKTEGGEGDTTVRTMHDFETLLGVDFSKRSIVIQGDREEAAETSHLHAEADGGCIAEKAAATLPTSVLQNIFAKLAS